MKGKGKWKSTSVVVKDTQPPPSQHGVLAANVVGASRTLGLKTRIATTVRRSNRLSVEFKKAASGTSKNKAT